MDTTITPQQKGSRFDLILGPFLVLGSHVLPVSARFLSEFNIHIHMHVRPIWHPVYVSVNKPMHQSFDVAWWWTGHLSRVAPILHPNDSWDGLQHTPVTVGARLKLSYLCVALSRSVTFWGKTSLREYVAGREGDKYSTSQRNMVHHLFSDLQQSHQKSKACWFNYSVAFQYVNCQVSYFPSSTHPLNFPLAEDVELKQQLYMCVPRLNMVVDAALLPVYTCVTHQFTVVRQTRRAKLLHTIHCSNHNGYIHECDWAPLMIGLMFNIQQQLRSGDFVRLSQFLHLFLGLAVGKFSMLTHFSDDHFCERLSLRTFYAMLISVLILLVTSQLKGGSCLCFFLYFLYFLFRADLPHICITASK